MQTYIVTVKGFGGGQSFQALTPKQAKMLAFKAIKEAGYSYSLPDFMAVTSARPWTLADVEMEAQDG